MSVVSIVKCEASKLSSRVFVAPDIPEKYLNNAVISISESKADPDVVIAVLDTSLLNSCKAGVLFTGDSLFFKGTLGSSIQIKYEDIGSAQEKITKTKKDDGSVTETKTLLIKGKDGSELYNKHDIYDLKLLAKIITEIIEEGSSTDSEGTVDVFKNTNQVLPLSDCESVIKQAYIKIICNYALSDDGIIDSREYSEIYSIMVRNDYSNEDRMTVRAYIIGDSEKDSIDNLVSILNENVPEGSRDALMKSIVKDLVYINHVKGNGLDAWKRNDFICDTAKKLNVTSDQISVIIQSIQNDEDIIAKRKSDTEIEKSIKEIAAKGASVGVPLAALYFSGTVGFSAAGITSGLATLGMGGMLGFSSMVTGIGVVIITGLLAYNGVKKLTGAKDLENNKVREMLIQGVIKNLQKSINYLIEDVNYISGELIQALENQVDDEEKITKLKKLLQTFIDASNISSQNLLVNAKESIIAKLPTKLDKTRFDELTSEPTKQKLRPFVYQMYPETEETVKSGDTQKKVKVYKIDYSKETEYYEKLYQILNTLEYFKLSTAITAAGTSLAKKGLGALKSTLGM
ncbi:hypothetical protein GWP43_07540 [Treponema vincentii]|uniref:ENT domain-containing protein n=1 Tax=Treponema vincentii TaxID=69710 RepID=A0A6P1Y1C2_9SPIR|nr:hypothetical protein [Treponema vincentii]QHX43324.1 hypothetical protein GWP43_07540 [Treponema vincentii]